MSRAVKISPCPAVDAAIRPPGSKSITNRAIVCAALATGVSHLTGVLESDDTEVMIAAWQKVGLRLEHDRESQTLVVEGGGGTLPVDEAEIYVANSGTTIRFLTAALTACHGHFRLDGVARMRERPIGDLMRALTNLGGRLSSLNPQAPDCPPVEIQALGLDGGHTSIAGNISSQFLSGLMMASPMARSDVRLEVSGELVSIPYVEMTSSVMRSFGAQVTGEPRETIEISAAHRYVGVPFVIEPDASAASYFWAAAAITGGRARVEGLNRESLQGDVGFCDVLQKMGCRVVYGPDFVEVDARHLASGELAGLDVNMADISDTVQTLAAVSLFATGVTTVRGVAHNRVKETDRITDLATELRKLGARVSEFADGMTIEPPAKINTATIETYHDHRMAMSLALVGLKTEGVTILDPGCTAKTYPQYWTDLQRFSSCGIDWRD